jgi:hypothetical protein
MSGLERTRAAARRGAAWLLPADRRDWVAAVWAEAHEVPPGLERLAWRVGGIWMLARGALMPRMLVRMALFAVAAAVAAWTAWPDSSVLHAAADQFGLIATVLLLAGLPLLARRFFGPVSDGRIARFLRVAGYAAILALMPARAVVGPYPLTVPQRGPDLRVFIAAGNSTHGMPGTSAGGPPWPGEIFFLVLTACYVITLLWVTSRRSSVTPATLAIGTGVGLLFGLVMFSVAPLGLGSYAGGGRGASRPVVLPPTGPLHRVGPGQDRPGFRGRDRREHGRCVVRCRSRHRDHRADDQGGMAAAVGLPLFAPERGRRVRSCAARQPARRQLHNHVRDLPDHRAHHERHGRGRLDAGTVPVRAAAG